MLIHIPRNIRCVGYCVLVSIFKSLLINWLFFYYIYINYSDNNMYLIPRLCLPHILPFHCVQVTLNNKKIYIFHHQQKQVTLKK